MHGISENLRANIPPTAGKVLVAALAILHYDGPVGDVDHEVAEDVGQQLLVDQLVHRALPLVQDLHEDAEIAGICHVSGVGHCHDLSLE